MYDALQPKEGKKPKCMLCYFVRVFASITFVLFLILVIYKRFVAPTGAVVF
jgi:hypothetical protein